MQCKYKNQLPPEMSHYDCKTCLGLFFLSKLFRVFLFFFHFQRISKELLTSNICAFLIKYDIMKIKDENSSKKYFYCNRKEVNKYL